MLKANRFELVFSLLISLVALRAGAIQQFYGPNDIANSRSLDTNSISELNAQNKRIGWRGKPLNPAVMLEGDHRISITVVDEHTLKPLTDYVIHGVVLGHLYPGEEPNDEDDPQSAKFKTLPFDEIIGIGRLESKRVHDSAGRCSYDQLGKLEVEFQVCAEGYVTRGKAVKIPEDGTNLTIRMTRSGAICGRVIRIDGTPAKGIAFEVRYEGRDDKGMHTGYSYQTEAGADGIFCLDGLPPDDYSGFFPTIPSRNSDIERVIDSQIRAEEEKTGRLLSYEQRKRRREELASEPVLTRPLIPKIHLTPGGRIDLGTIQLQKAPVVDVEIVGQNASPMVDFPFEIMYSSDSIHSKTDQQGKARVVLAGVMEREEGVLFAPNSMREQYQPKRHKPKRGTDLPEVNEREREQIRALEANEAAKADHPNYELFTVQPGGVGKVKLVYKQAVEAMNPRLFFRDRMSGRPVASFKGIIHFGQTTDYALINFDREAERMVGSEFGDARFFQSADQTGRVTVSNVTAPVGFFMEEQDRLRRLSQKETLYNDSGAGRIRMTVDAPGYARQAFEVTSAQLRSGEELTFDLEPEARVTGRAVIGGTGEPLTAENLKAMLIRKKQWKKEMDRELRYARIGVVMTNNSLEGSALAMDKQHWPSMAHAIVGTDGRFEIRGLRPADGWDIRVGTDAIPKMTRTVALKPGANDLGDFMFGGEGLLTVTVRDEQGRPLPGTYLKWPLGAEDISDVSEPDETRDKKNNPVTDAAGIMSFRMLALKCDRQIVRLVPPWGVQETSVDREDIEPRIMFDAVMELDRTAGKSIEARLERGHRLTIELPRSPVLDELVRASKGEYRPVYNRRNPRPTFLALSAVNLQATKPDARGFVYHQRFMPYGGIELTTRTASTTIQVEDVPPGRYHLCVVGNSFIPPSHPEYADTKDTATRMQYRHTAYTMATTVAAGTPLAFVEFDMQPQPTTVGLELNAASVEVGLERPETVPLRDAVVFMDRTEPLSMEFGGDCRRILAQASANRSSLRAMEELTTPMVGFFEGFIKPEPLPKNEYRPALFRAVPPGTYNVAVYANVNDALARPPRVYCKKTIEVGRGAGTIRVTATVSGQKPSQ